MPGLYSRLKNWVRNENLSEEDLNAEFNYIIQNFIPGKVDDYSANVTQMQTETTPGAVSSESLATSLAGEVERLRFVIRRMIGDAASYKWYSAPPKSIKEINDLLSINVAVPNSRIVSGRIDADNQPIYLVPDGAARTVRLKALTTNLVCYINGTTFTASTDIVLSGLSAAPSSNNTAQNITYQYIQDTANSRQVGERYGQDVNPTKAIPQPFIFMGSVGSEISVLVGKRAAFKIAGAATEYFTAFVYSSTLLTDVRRGDFFDSADAGIARTTIANTNVITLMKLSYIFLKNDSTLDVTYNEPYYGPSEPSSAASGDFWFDTVADQWKKFSGASWSNTSTIYVGVCIQDATNTVGARSKEIYADYSPLLNLALIDYSTTLIKDTRQGSAISVAGQLYEFTASGLSWNNTVLESGVTLNSGRPCFLYVKDTGSTIISDKAPHDRTQDLFGFYHPFKPWRCVGSISNNSTVFTAGTLLQIHAVPEKNLRMRDRDKEAVDFASGTSVRKQLAGSSVTVTASSAHTSTTTGYVANGVGGFLMPFLGRGQTLEVDIGPTITLNATVSGAVFATATTNVGDTGTLGIGVIDFQTGAVLFAETICGRVTSVGTTTVSTPKLMKFGPIPSGRLVYLSTIISVEARVGTITFTVTNAMPRVTEVLC